MCAGGNKGWLMRNWFIRGGRLDRDLRYILGEGDPRSGCCKFGGGASQGVVSSIGSSGRICELCVGLVSAVRIFRRLPAFACTGDVVLFDD